MFVRQFLREVARDQTGPQAQAKITLLGQELLSEVGFRYNQEIGLWVGQAAIRGIDAVDQTRRIFDPNAAQRDPQASEGLLHIEGFRVPYMKGQLLGAQLPVTEHTMQPTNPHGYIEGALGTYLLADLTHPEMPLEAVADAFRTVQKLTAFALHLYGVTPSL